MPSPTPPQGARFEPWHAAQHAGTEPRERQAHEPHIVVQRVDTRAGRRNELLEGLLSQPPRIAPKFFYDAQGCALYEAIVLLQEYYPPRLEQAIFERHHEALVAALPAGAQLVDLGCGDGAKAMRWLAPLQVRRYVGVDIAPGWLRSTLQRGARAYPDIEFSGVVTDFTHGLDIRAQLDPDAPRIFFYPGSSIGNFDPADAARLLGEVRQHLRRNDRLLIGVDAPKDPATLVAAYDDALGVTAAFNRNVLRVVNEELGTDFELGNFSHRALFDERHSRIEMHLLARQATTVRLSAQHERRFEAGEAIVTEHSYKYEPARFLALLERAGYGDVSCFQDESAGYGVYVAGVGPGLQ